MDELNLPAWTAELTGRDVTWLVGRLERDPENRKSILTEFEEEVRTEIYRVYRGALTGTPLEEMAIILPTLPTDDDEIREEWAQDADNPNGTWGEIHRDLQGYRVREWVETCREFEGNPLDFANAWQYLNHHPAFWEFRCNDGITTPEDRVHEKHLIHEFGIHRCLDIIVTKVNPSTGMIDDEEWRNTLTQVWIELGPTHWPGEGGWPVADGEFFPRECKTHDYLLDCGGDSVEAAIVNAAIYVHTAYGNDRRICDEKIRP